MAQLPAEEQNAIWGLTEAQLTSNSKYVWQYMADNSDTEWVMETAAADISSAMGQSLSVEEVDTSLTELDDKGLVSSARIKVESPPSA